MDAGGEEAAFKAFEAEGWTRKAKTYDRLTGRATARLVVPLLEAAGVESGTLPAATELWTGLDRELTRRAIWLPTVTVNGTDLISRRAGNYQHNPLWGPLPDQLWVR